MAEGKDPKSGPLKHDVLPPELWIKSWEENFIPFHYPGVTPFLKDHLEEFINGREKIKVFVPLCGKAVDMKWLYDLGHTVVGVEVARVALESFFKENGLEYTRSECPQVKGHLFQSKDGRIKLYECDLFNFSSNEEGKFDAIFDRGSFGAIGESQRERYAALMMDLMEVGCRYIVVCFDYDRSLMKGPPHSIPEYEYRDLFGEKCTVTQIDYRHQTTDEDWSKRGIKQMYEKAHMIIPK